jgi:hypothetical protein
LTSGGEKYKEERTGGDRETKQEKDERYKEMC